MSAQPHRKVTHHRPPVVHPHGTAVDRPDFLPDDAKIGDNPEVLAVLQDYVSNYAHEDRHIDHYAFGPSPSDDYRHFIAGQSTICYYWDSSHASTGEYTETGGEYVLERVHEGKTTWAD